LASVVFIDDSTEVALQHHGRLREVPLVGPIKEEAVADRNGCTGKNGCIPGMLHRPALAFK
jgi:hypothetical protein